MLGLFRVTYNSTHNVSSLLPLLPSKVSTKAGAHQLLDLKTAVDAVDAVDEDFHDSSDPLKNDHTQSAAKTCVEILTERGRLAIWFHEGESDLEASRVYAVVTNTLGKKETRLCWGELDTSKNGVLGPV